MTRPAATPRFDPDSALGWRDVGLDGLSCYLRCVEAVLAHHGRTPREILFSLAAPVELGRSDRGRGPFGSFPGVQVTWHRQTGGLARDVLDQLLREDRHVVVSPDGCHWPGDEGEGQRHDHHHMVLPIRVGPDEVDVLDTDAPDQIGFVRSVPGSGAVIPAFDRFATVELRPVPVDADAAAAVDRLLAGTAAGLEADLAELAGLGRRWAQEPLPALLARGLHVFVLGDVQPQLFTLAGALDALGRPDVAPLAGALTEAAARAKKFGILLTGLHRFRSPQVYAICLDEFEAMHKALLGVLDALAAHPAAVAGSPGPPAPTRVAHRLAEVTEWSFGVPVPESVRWILDGGSSVPTAVTDREEIS